MRGRRRFALALAGALVGGCAAPSVEEPARREPGAGAAELGAPRRPAAPVRIAGVRWPAPARIDAAALARLSPAARAAVGRSPVPALVPRAQSLAGEVFVTSGEHHFAVSANDGRIALSLHASRLFYDRAVPASQGNRALRGTRALVTENEGIWSASWMEHGVAYTLELECARHDDARCAGDRHLVALAEGLSYVGGAGGGP